MSWQRKEIIRWTRYVNDLPVGPADRARSLWYQVQCRGTREYLAYRMIQRQPQGIGNGTVITLTFLGEAGYLRDAKRICTADLAELDRKEDWTS